VSRYLYALVRCVPDPQTGEFVNVAAIAGDPTTGDWSLRQVSNESRVRKVAGAAQLDAVHRFLTEIGLRIDEMRAQMEENSAVTLLDDNWLQALYHDHRNVVQLSAPTPLVADDAEQALDVIFGRQVIDPLLQTREKIVTKWRVISDVREAYRRAHVDDRLVQPKPELFVGEHVHTPLDFAIVAGQAVQLTQGWSFMRSQVDEVSTQVKAWAYAIQLLRGKEEARLVSAREQVSGIAHDVDLEVVVAPPKTTEQIRAYDEAQQVFSRLGAYVRDLDRVDDVGRQAAELVFKAGYVG
jgi:Protein of unknown function (DUF3037)